MSVKISILVQNKKNKNINVRFDSHKQIILIKNLVKINRNTFIVFTQLKYTLKIHKYNLTIEKCCEYLKCQRDHHHLVLVTPLRG